MPPQPSPGAIKTESTSGAAACAVMHELPCSSCVACIPPSVAWQQHAHQSPAVHMAPALQALPPHPASATCPAAAPRMPKLPTSLYRNASQLRPCAPKPCTADGPGTKKTLMYRVLHRHAASPLSGPLPSPSRGAKLCPGSHVSAQSLPKRAAPAEGPCQPASPPANRERAPAAPGRGWPLWSCASSCAARQASCGARVGLPGLAGRQGGECYQPSGLASLLRSSCPSFRPCWLTRG